MIRKISSRLTEPVVVPVSIALGQIDLLSNTNMRHKFINLYGKKPFTVGSQIGELVIFTPLPHSTMLSRSKQIHWQKP